MQNKKSVCKAPKGYRIGVLGGVGHESSAVYYLKLVKRLQERLRMKNNSEYPQVIINGISAPDLVATRATKRRLKKYIEGIKELARMRVDFIVMVCNTIHLYYDLLQKEVNVPILDLRVEVAKKLKENGINRVAVLGTRNTIENGLYRFDGVRYDELSEVEVNKVSSAILKYLIGYKKEEQAAKVKAIARKYLNKGSQAVVLGCTELSLMLHDEHLPTIDTIDVLVEATINRILKNKE